MFAVGRVGWELLGEEDFAFAVAGRADQIKGGGA
jgi:hypothetical protein